MDTIHFAPIFIEKGICMRLLHKVLLLPLIFFIVGCSSQQPKQTVSWIDIINKMRGDARNLSSTIVLDRIMVTPEEVYIEDTNILRTTVFFVDKDRFSLWESTFTQNSLPPALKESGTSSLSNKDADDLFRLIRVSPDEALIKANTQLPSYQEKHLEKISFFLELNSGNDVPEKLRSSSKLVWQVRYSARNTRTAFLVWIDAQTGDVLQTQFEDLN